MTLETAPICSECKNPMALRQAPFPVMLQLIFALSFVGFLLCFDAIRAKRIFIWLWSAVQIGLGFLLIRARMKARIHIYRCIRCDSALP